MNKNIHASSFFLLLICLISSSTTFPAEHHEQIGQKGTFYHTYWYESGIEHGNPSFNSRLRVNSPDVVLHERFGIRSEVKGNGMMQILIEEDLSLLDGAELYLEIWGGHPGTANKRVTINGRSTYMLPEVGTAAHNCTHMYPTLKLKITDLVNGYNVLQFACDEGDSFWGHFIVENACLRLQLKPDHPVLQETGLDLFQTSIQTEMNDETIRLSLNNTNGISQVDYQSNYFGYDENGDGIEKDWHGFTKAREPVSYAGTSPSLPFAAEWDTSLLVQQHNVPVRAWVRFKDHPKLLYLTEPASIRSIGSSSVHFYASNDIPSPFWSRADRLNTCTINLDADPNDIEKAVLHCVTWDGGKGNVEDYFTLNGHPLPAAGNGRHDVLYKQLEIKPKMLKKGVNTIELLSDTEHHGIEVLLPGPVLVVKLKK